METDERIQEERRLQRTAEHGGEGQASPPGSRRRFRHALSRFLSAMAERGSKYDGLPSLLRGGNRPPFSSSIEGSLVSVKSSPAASCSFHRSMTPPSFALAVGLIGLVEAAALLSSVWRRMPMVELSIATTVRSRADIHDWIVPRGTVVLSRSTSIPTELPCLSASVVYTARLAI
jgi:hypothetical protein